jgi:hypothetical protein
MDWLLDAAIIGGMFILRLGVPLAITLAVGYFLRRLDAKWQAEAWAQWEASQPEEKIIGESKLLRAGKQPCWSLKGCHETVCANCAAPKHPDIPCWMARRRSEGRLPAGCYNCEYFSLRQVAQSLAS